MESLLSLFYFLLFCFLIYRLKFFNLPPLSRKIVIAFFVLKIIAGLFLSWLYLSVYDPEKADTYRYFKDAKIVFSAYEQNSADYLRLVSGVDSDSPSLDPYYEKLGFWERSPDDAFFNDNRTIIRLNALLMFFSFKFYFVHVIFMAFLAFLGQVALFKFFKDAFPVHPYFNAFSSFLIPSVILWSSGILKEVILLSGLGFFLLSLMRIVSQAGSTRWWILLIVSCCMLCMIKIYVIVALIPSLLFLAWLKISGNKSIAIKFISSHLVCLFALFIFNFLFTDLNLFSMISDKRTDFIHVAISEKAGSLISTQPMTPDWKGLLVMIPSALFNVFLRPLPGQLNSIIIIPPFIENMIFYLLALISIIYFKKPKPEVSAGILSIFSFVIILSIIIGLTTPVLGAIVRYKMPALPFLAILFFSMMDVEKLKTAFPFIKKFMSL